ncbi:hypothetical protein P0F65_03560 [Sphingomonas sp. I4]
MAEVGVDPADARRYLALVTAATERLMAADDPGAMIDSLFALIRDELRLDVFFHFRRDGEVARLETSGGLTRAERQAAAALDVEGSVSGQVMRDRQPLHFSQIQQGDDAQTAFVRMLGSMSICACRFCTARNCSARWVSGVVARGPLPRMSGGCCRCCAIIPRWRSTGCASRRRCAVVSTRRRGCWPN